MTALTLLKNFYNEEIFNLLAKPIYDADLAVSEAAIRASGSPGNEVAVEHLYKIIEGGKKSQRLAAIQALAAIRAPTSVGMLIKYFNHFSGEDDVRTAILGTLNAVAPSHRQVQELDQAVVVDPRHGEEARRIAVEALVDTSLAFLLDSEKQTDKRALLLKLESLQEAALRRMLHSGVQEVPDFTREHLAPGPLGAYLCLYTLKADSREQPQKQLARQPARLLYQPNWALDSLRRGQRQTVRSFLLGLTDFPGRPRFPSRVLKLLLVIPFVDVETEGLVGDSLRRIVDQMKKESPQLLNEFAESAANRLEKVFARIHQTFISVRGITRKEELLMAVLASLLERHATPALLGETQAFFRDEAPNRVVVDQLRTLFAGAPREDRNRFEACLQLFQTRERKDRLAMANVLSRVDLNRPLELRQLNRLIRLAGVLDIRTSSHKILEILEFARAERVPFLEETSIVTLCQLMVRTVIAQSPQYFHDPGRSPRSLNGYIRGARYLKPVRIMIGQLVPLLLQPKLDQGSRALAVESLEHMDLSEVAKSLPPLLKAFDLEAIDEGVRLRIADVLAKAADAGLAHLALDLTGSPSALGRRAAVRVLRGLCSRKAGVSKDTLTERLYRLLEDADRAVRLESLLALLAIDDDYAAQVVNDEVQAGRTDFVAELLEAIPRPLSRESFGLVRSLLTVESAPVQAAIRSLAPELCQGAFAEETRQVLVRSLVPPVGGAPLGEPSAPLAAPAPSGSALEQAKLRFKFQREYVQVLTVLFIDIAEWTKKSSEISPKAASDLIKAFEGNVVPTIIENHGRVVKKMGDAILAVFKQPVNAVIAAMALQQKINQYSSMRLEQEKFQVRIGLNSGEVTWKDNDVFGNTVNLASRMQTTAEKGGIQLTEYTFKEVREHVRCTRLGSVNAKGIGDVTAYQPEEILVDLRQVRVADGGERHPVQAGSLQRLRQSMFEPEFKVPGDKAGRPAADLLHELFGEIARAVGDLLTDSQEYDFQKYLQDRWNDLMRRL